jgi:hypothetical protein|tara:strand:- start:516 stop:692 length:177 start_codon:yes stop_codon:yes gene_type:complete
MSYTKSRSWTQRVNEKLDDDTRAIADELGWKLPEYVRMAVEILNKRMEERIPATEEQY